MDKFKRRIYPSIGAFFKDFWGILSRSREIRPLMRGQLIDPAFRERLMLVVTGVNQCRYCSYAHAREALSEGVSEAEIEALGQGVFDGSPPEEAQALLYAQHWAETRGAPDAEARTRIAERYGEKTVEAMELTFQMIRAGNLMGNTFDYILYRLTFGRLGAG